MIWSIILFVFAIAVVVKTADWFLDAAEKVGGTLRLPPFILGVLLVGIGTSLPELATSLAAVNDGINTISIANIAGSNVANTLLIIGISTIALGTIRFKKDIIDLDIPLLLGVTALFCLLIVDGSLNRADGVLLLLGFVGYIVYTLGYSEDEKHHKGISMIFAKITKRNKIESDENSKKMNGFTLPILIISIVVLAVSSKLAVSSMLDVVNELNIGVAIVSFFALAIGTSLPELVVSIKALKKGKGDLVIGNIIGSSMFNILLITGITSTITTQFIDQKLVVWVIVGLGISSLLLTVSSISKRIHIWEGIIYILIYLAIASYIIRI